MKNSVEKKEMRRLETNFKRCYEMGNLTGSMLFFFVGGVEVYQGMRCKVLIFRPCAK
jgi:hypothetical protein